MNVVLRDGKESDWGFCLATWVRTFPQLGDRTTRLNHMRRALSRGQLIVACSDEDPDTLIGWALAENGDLWWTYVSKDFRQSKLSRSLQQKAKEKSQVSK